MSEYKGEKSSRGECKVGKENTGIAMIAGPNVDSTTKLRKTATRDILT